MEKSITFTGGQTVRNTYTDWCEDANIGGCWRFNGAEYESLLDESGNDNHGTNSGATYTTGCVGGDCYDFNGSSDYINIKHDTSLESATAFSAYIVLKSDDTIDGAATRQAISKLSDTSGTANWQFGWDHTNSSFQQSWIFYNTAAAWKPCKYTTSLSSSTIYHLFMTYDQSVSSGTMKIYVNSSTADTTCTSMGTAKIYANGLGGLFVGSGSSNGTAASSYFDGIIYKAAFWDGKVLSETEILDIYNNGLR